MIMGQLFSSSADAHHQDLASSFTNYFKNFKAETKIISREIIASIESNLTRGNIQGTNSAISDALKEIDSAPLNVAVTGESGAGKSSFINALRGLGHEEEDSAPTGVVETTMQRKAYKHPAIPNVLIWDLPGIGSPNFQPKDYLAKVQFKEYDFFIIVSATRFRKNDIDLAKAIRIMKKDFYFVRTKVDSDLKNEEESKPRTFDREKVLQQIRKDCANAFKQSDTEVPQIFLISNHQFSEYDFPVLMGILINHLPVHKRHKFMLFLPNITEAAIQRKQDSLKQRIWLEAFGAGILAAVAPQMCLRDSDVQMLKACLSYYQALFGVDDMSLQSLAKKWQMPVEELKALMRSPNLLQTRNEETILERLIGYYREFCLDSGYFLPRNLSFQDFFYLKFYFLDVVANDARILLKEICLRNN